MEKINFNSLDGGSEMNNSGKEVFGNFLEIRQAISGLINNFKVFEKVIIKVYKENNFSYPSSRFKIKLLEEVSGKTCSVAEIQKIERFYPDFNKYSKTVFFKLNGVAELQKAKGLKVETKNLSENDVKKIFGYKQDAKSYDPNAPKVGIEKQFKD